MTHILSMNIRGLGSASKTNCLRELLLDKIPIIFMVQETMCMREKAIKMFLNMRQGWHAAAVDAVGGAYINMEPSICQLSGL